MQEPSVWEMVLAGALALLVVFMMRGGVAAAMKRSRDAENKDWKGVALPLGAVVLFVLLLIMMVS